MDKKKEWLVTGIVTSIVMIVLGIGISLMPILMGEFATPFMSIISGIAIISLILFIMALKLKEEISYIASGIGWILVSAQFGLSGWMLLLTFEAFNLFFIIPFAVIALPFLIIGLLVIFARKALVTIENLVDYIKTVIGSIVAVGGLYIISVGGIMIPS